MRSGVKVYMAYRYRKDIVKGLISFGWFMRKFADVLASEDLIPPSKGKVQGFLLRRGISLQNVRDRKSKTAAERMNQIRDQLCGLDEFQRRDIVDSDYGRASPEKMFMYDEYSISVISRAKRSYADRGGDDNHIKQPNDLFSREMTGIFFGRYKGAQPKKLVA